MRPADLFHHCRYIQDEMPEPLDPASARPVAAHLIQIGTPNRGTPCADVTGLPIQYELRTDVATAFNNEVTDRA